MPIDVDHSVGFAFQLALATERFVLAHEYAHLLEGHLGTSRERTANDWLHRTREQELQADETGALLVLRGLKEEADPMMAQGAIYLAVTGPLFFFVIDHLITRVRRELDGIPHSVRLSGHPTSDEL